jgi:succinate-acetate transporter protein
MILAMALYGGAAQIIAGMEWKKGNTFATTALFPRFILARSWR